MPDPQPKQTRMLVELGWGGESELLRLGDSNVEVKRGSVHGADLVLSRRRYFEVGKLVITSAFFDGNGLCSTCNR